MRLLMALPVGGGDYGGLVERPTHPKPTGDASEAPLLRRRALLDGDRDMEEDGNWNEGDGMADMGFNQGDASKIGGIVDMEDDVYLEFDEEGPVKKEPSEQTTWQILARYMANFKPNTRAMFKRFIDEVWHLRNGIRYSEKGKNYYGITLFSKGDYDFVMRGGPWIFNHNALVVTVLDAIEQPSETKLDSILVWVRIYDVPWGKQDETWGMRYGNGLGKSIEIDVPASEEDKKDFLRVRVWLPYDRRLQTQITTGVKGKPREVKVFKLKYERVPYYCSHCGFMGHKKDDCEKKRLGVPSLDYDAHELRCSPYKKFEHRTYYAPRSRVQQINDDMPPLMDDLVPIDDDLANEAAAGRVNGATASVPQEVEGNLVKRVESSWGRATPISNTTLQRVGMPHSLSSNSQRKKGRVLRSKWATSK
ncbi:hypothetical protein QYE76_004555 [Lolium multiflorum]|uniref:CCHC-type domain-containing protein n=1 Tax=Lolium multiflorum TaxID=4521 RepID=A0AAD8VZX9_LOLMU|nr:hypothetical protein QYE76_004555 [Lolium multiflorum]